ncbi:hypothetical protein SPV_2485 [Streptococcus pneumoniae]|nr:hypothetical protein SPV_2485 [Streptococcus pneumoniae]
MLLHSIVYFCSCCYALCIMY